jgi:phytol kinase
MESRSGRNKRDSTLNLIVKPDIMDEMLRKVVHFFLGLGIAIAIPLFDRQMVLAAFVIAIFVGFIISDALSRGYTIPLISRVIALLERKDVLPGKGTLYFAIGVFFCLVFFPLAVVVPAVICLAVLDGVATIIGVRFGRHRIWKGKSLEGTLAGIGATIVALVILTSLSPFLILTAAVIAGIVELLTPVDDNLVIPVSVCIVLTLLH